MEKNPYRLDGSVRPVLYDLQLEPDLERFCFEGRETLTFDLKKALSTLVLHAADLDIQSAVLESAGSPPAEAKKIRYNPRLETVALDFGKRIKPGKSFKLSLRFKGELNDKMHGFYRTSYRLDGVQKWGAATQFEATDARRAFPCIDEPAAKARFRASLKIPAHLTALSNMPVESETVDSVSGTKSIVYQTTPVMSSYLLCFVVAELECVESRDKNGIPVRVWTTPGKKEQGLFALDVARHALPYFADWFGIPYALPKLDMAALPDFSSGAMENWGLVTYRETALLVDEKNSSTSAKQRVAEVIDHELAHQWFGNLVTMEWWTDLWLNEGFASYMGPKAVDHQFRSWKIWDQFVTAETFSALHDDALRNSHPIEIDVKDPHEIREIFDHITYNKGSSVNRMLEHFLGESVFRKGLRRYLKRYAYRNAKTSDLWRELEKASGQPVRAMMESFTRQEGYPFLSAETSKKGKRTLRLEQRRFLLDGGKDPKNFSWKVPVTLRAGSKRKAEVLSGARMEVSLPPGQGWIQLNPGQSGFYRTRYSPELWQPLLKALSSSRLAAIDCAGIVNDAFFLARAGYQPSSRFLEAVRACRTQEDYNVWLAVSGVLGSVENILPEGKPADDLASFARKLLEPIWKNTGWKTRPADSHTRILLRSLILSRIGHFGEDAVRGEARRLFQTQAPQGKLDPDLRGAVYGIAAESGTEAELDSFMSLYRKTELQEEKVRLLRAMTRFRKKNAVQRVLAFALSGEVRPQDTYAILAGFGSNSAARRQNWAFVKSNWKKISSLYKSGSVGLLGHILDGAVSGFNDLSSWKDAKSFFRAHPVRGTERTCRQALESIRTNHFWKKRAEGEIAAWLSTQASGF